MFKCLSNKDLSMIPILFETDDRNITKKEKIVHLHFFNDLTHWFVVESNGEDTFYGIVITNLEVDTSEWRDIPFIELQMSDQNSAPIKYDNNWNPVKAGSVDIIKQTFGW